MVEWHFLTNHSLTLSLISKKPRVTAREIALNIGITERAVRKVIADLNADDYITKERVGRGSRYRINPDLSLRHHTQRDTAVGDFLQMLGWRPRGRRTVKNDKDKPQ